MTGVLSCIVSYCGNAIWAVAVLGAAEFAVSRLLRRLGPAAQHVTWITSLALCVVIPAVPMLGPLLIPGASHAVIEHHSSLALLSAPVDAARRSHALFLSPALVIVLSSMYLCTVLYFAVRLCWQLHCTRSIVRDAQPAHLSHEKEAIWTRTANAFAINNALLLNSEAVCGPVAVQLKAPLLLVPKRFLDECTVHDFGAALAHEFAHLARRDFQKNLFYEVVSLLIAFHPVTWIIKSQIARTREMICDVLATQKLMDARQYTYSLVRLVALISCAPPAPSSTAIGMFDAGPKVLEERIMMIRTKKERLPRNSRYSLLLLGALSLCAVAGGSAAMTRLIQTQNGAMTRDAGPDKVKHKNLSCTYYDSQVKPHEGTCGLKSDDNTPYCFRNDDKNVSEVQIGCASKLGIKLSNSH
jgi:beta-lactamase regulating signal transducer with metallopeptidase domain